MIVTDFPETSDTHKYRKKCKAASYIIDVISRILLTNMTPSSTDLNHFNKQLVDAVRISSSTQHNMANFVYI